MGTRQAKYAAGMAVVVEGKGAGQCIGYLKVVEVVVLEGGTSADSLAGI
jgi:hypothetical protein